MRTLSLTVTALFFALTFGADMLGASPHARVPQQGPPQPVRWALALEPASGTIAAGGAVKAVVTAAIDEGWHVYAPDEANSGPRPVTISVAKGGAFEATGKLDAPEPEREMDEAFGQITASYAGETTFRLPVTTLPDTPAGTYPLKIEITFQACDGKICLPAKVVRLEAPVAITGR
ncbi:MAG: protein-disulfide reductase DsbD family protein [Vicinamibacterales bacterium]|nr:protein-disulfide reductase DsbD family protein [Vicinamibacterales bacterium]